MLIHLISRYLDTVKGSRSSKTHKAYEYALKTFVDAVGMNAVLTKETYINFLNKTSGLNVSTQSLYRSAVKGFYLFAADVDTTVPTAFFAETNKRYALRNPNDDMEYNEAGIDKIIQYCSTIRNDIADLRDRAFVLFLADTGLRNGEACGLRISSVDWNEYKVSFIGKGNRKAKVHISNRAIDALRDYLQERGNPARTQPLFIRHDKKAGNQIKQVTPGSMWKVVKRRAMEAGVDPATIRVHDFRHYFVTTVYRASKDIRLAQKLARHKKIETTSRYTHLTDDSGKEYHDIFNR